MSSLLDIDTSVPSSPCLQGGEHSTLSAHVTESGLTTSVGTRSGDSGNTGDGSSCSPRLSTMGHTSLWVNSMGLSSVLGNV